MKKTFAYVRPNLVLYAWTEGQPIAQVELTRQHALALIGELARGIAETDV